MGLGNPGPEHLLTRHNAGFWFVDALANKLSLTFSPDKKFQSELCRYQNGSTDCWLCKPQTYMNESGTAVQALISYYKIPMDQLLVVHDEIVVHAPKDKETMATEWLRNAMISGMEEVLWSVPVLVDVKPGDSYAIE